MARTGHAEAVGRVHVDGALLVNVVDHLLRQFHVVALGGGP
jgi:hypothetical protein